MNYSPVHCPWSHKRGSTCGNTRVVTQYCTLVTDLIVRVSVDNNLSFDGDVWNATPIEVVVLKHEKDVEQNRESTKTKLGWIGKERRPIVCNDTNTKRTRVICMYTKSRNESIREATHYY